MVQLAYNLWIDDMRNPRHTLNKADAVPILWARDVEQAQYYIRELGMQGVMYLDHDLGECSTVMEFLRWLASECYKPEFDYRIISANPDGSKNIESFINSWKRSVSKREGV
jgi:hypothetical protein